MFSLVVWILIAILITATNVYAALTVSFGESDVSVTEKDKHVTVSVTKAGLSRGNITCTLIPLSVEQAFLQYGYQPDGSSDPAEIGLDFSPALTEHVFGPGIETVDRQLAVEVIDDDVMENEEVFWVQLNVSVHDSLDEEELEMGRQRLLIRIMRDGGDVSIVRGVMLSKTVSEGAGIVEDFITIFKEGKSELPLSFSIGVDVGSGVTAVKEFDYELQTGQFTILPSEDNITISLRVIDDEVAENVQKFRWTLSQIKTEFFDVEIADNDLVTVRFTNSTEMTVEEGDTVTLCAEIESPPEIDRQINILGALLPGTAETPTDYDLSSTPFYSLDGSNRKICREIRTLDDNLPESTEQFSLTLSHFQADGLIVLQPDLITFVLDDNDIPGVHVALTDNATSSEGVILMEGEGTVDDLIRISVPEPHSIPVQVSVSVSSGSAERGADFEVVTGTFTLVPGNSSVILSVSVLEDEYVEYDEQWTLIISQPDTEFPSLTIPFTITDNDRVTVGFVNDSTVRVGEGEVVRVCGKLVDVAPSLLQREIVLEGHTLPGTAEEGSDFKAELWNFTFSSSAGLTCVEVATTDDSVPELTESFSVTVQLLQPTRLIFVQPSAIDIIINNDDAPQLELEVAGSPSGTPVIINEGDGRLDKLIRIFSSGVHPFPLEYTVSVTPSTSEDFFVEAGTFLFSPTDTEHFLPITVAEDEVAEEDEQLSIVIVVPGQLPHIINVFITDDDGTPLAPVITEVKLLEDSRGDKLYNLTFSWEPRREDLRPIDSFSGTVTPQPSSRQADDSVVDQQPKLYSFSVDNTTTKHSIIDIQLAGQYTVQVCSRNKLGFNCSVPKTYPVSVLPPSPGGVGSHEEHGDDDDGDGLPAGVIVAIVMLVLLVLLCCCLFLICLFFCVCWCSDEWRNYHPEKKEKKNERDFSRYRGMYSREEGEEIDSDFDSDLGEEV